MDLNNWFSKDKEEPEKNVERLPKEEEFFDFSVLFQEEEPGSFTLPLIIILVINVITMIIVLVKK